MVSGASASTPSGVGVAVESRFEASVDGAGRRARQLLVADRPHQLGEVRAARATPAQVGGTEGVDDGSERGAPAGPAPRSPRSPRAGPRVATYRTPTLLPLTP